MNLEKKETCIANQVTAGLFLSTILFDGRTEYRLSQTTWSKKNSLLYIYFANLHF